VNKKTNKIERRTEMAKYIETRIEKKTINKGGGENGRI